MKFSLLLIIALSFCIIPSCGKTQTGNMRSVKSPAPAADDLSKDGGETAADAVEDKIQGKIEKVALNLQEHDGVSRIGEPVTSGIPLPKGLLKDISKVRLMEEGKEISAQFRASGLWQPDDSVRWLLVDFQTDIKANQAKKYSLEFGKGAAPSKFAPSPVKITEDSSAFIVNTGVASFRISKSSFSLFDEVRIKDKLMVAPRANASDQSRGAVLSGINSTVTRAIPDPSNTGRAHLIYVSCASNAVKQDYTLTYTTKDQFEVVGSISGSVGTGEYRKDFTGAGSTVSIPLDAWLQWKAPKQGDKFTFSVIQNDTTLTSEGIFSAKIIERGPQRSVIRVKGSFGPTAAPSLEYTAWYHFYAGSGRVKLSFTLENNDHGGRNGNNAKNAAIGGVNNVFFDEMMLRFPTELTSSAKAIVGGADKNAPVVADLASKMEIYQDSSGGEKWNKYSSNQPRPSSYVTFKGYKIRKATQEVAAGDRALGWLDLSDGTKGVTVSVENFWQNFPKALTANTDGSLQIGLFPGEYAGDFSFRSGEHKTHEVLFDFYSGPSTKDTAYAAAKGFSRPLRLEASPEWYSETEAFGVLHPFDLEKYTTYEIKNASIVNVHLNDTKFVSSLPYRKEAHDFFGWMDFGDVPIDFETPSGQWGMKYDLDYRMAVQYARTLMPEWWDTFVAADKHMRDIDIHHQPHYPGLHYVKGGIWAHSLHNEKGHVNPHRNYNHFTKDLAFGARGTAALHYLTGDWKSFHSSLEIAENALAEYMSPTEEPDPKENNRICKRGEGCTLHRLLEGYQLTGDKKYLDRARWQVKACAFVGKPKSHPQVPLWSSMFYLFALNRYLEMFPEDADARSYILAHLDIFLKSVVPESGIYYKITPQADGSVVGSQTAGHYNVLAADVLALGYKYTGDKKYIEAARDVFAYGLKAGGKSYYQIHSSNSMTHGNIFMELNPE